jgi:hypothetical protein
MRVSLVVLAMLVLAVPIVAVAIGIDVETRVVEKPALSKARVTRLEKQVADLQTRIPVLQKMLDDAQAELREGVRSVALTPAQAVESFKQNPKSAVAVEFGVGPIGFHEGLARVGDDPLPPMILTWDNYFPGGGTFSAIVPGRVYARLADFAGETPLDAVIIGENSFESLRRKIARHIEANGVRIIGLVEKHGDNYVIHVHEPGQVITYIKHSRHLGLQD